jgi:hypothetical protein
MNNATQKQIAAAFSEWDRRYRKEPERFQSEAAHLLRDTPKTYGDACAPYFLDILSDVQKGKPRGGKISIKTKPRAAAKRR